MPRLKKLLRENGLSLTFWLLFAVAMGGFWLAALRKLGGSAQPLASPEFVEAISSNWQAALLQLLLLILFSEFLQQRGAPHSKQKAGRKPRRQKHQKLSDWVYSNSLSIAFALLFALSFVIFFFSDLAKHNRNAAHPFTMGDFLASSEFWFDVLQTWQAECFAMGCLLVLSIFLRQEQSAESKPTRASDSETGNPNK